MKINNLLEGITAASSPENAESPAPIMGRSDKFLESENTDMTGKTCEKCKKGEYQETGVQDDMHGVLHCTKCGNETKRWKNYKEPVSETSAGATGSGSIASVSSPVGGMQRRGKGSIFAGIKTSDKYPNSKAVKESVNPQNFDSDEDYYDAVKKQGQQQFSGDWDVWDEIASLENQIKYTKSSALAHTLYQKIDQLKQQAGIEDDEDEYEKEYDADIRARKGMAEGEEMSTFAALKDWRVWDVHVYNNFYRGKYADYGPRLYSVVASSPEEARQVVINNPDYVLQDLLSRKLQSGKRVLPRVSALPIEAKRVGKADPGTITTMAFKKMLTPDGVQSFKFTNGKIVDGAYVQGGEEVEEGMSENRGYFDGMPTSDNDYFRIPGPDAKHATPQYSSEPGTSDETFYRVRYTNEAGQKEITGLVTHVDALRLAKKLYRKGATQVLLIPSSKGLGVTEGSQQRVEIVSVPGVPDMYVGQTGVIGKMRPDLAKKYPGYVQVDFDNAEGSTLLPKEAVKIKQGVEEGLGGDMAKLIGIPVVAGAAAIGAQHYDDQQPHVQVGGQNAKIVQYGSSRIPDTAMLLKGQDGKMYRVWQQSGKGMNKITLASPAEPVKEQELDEKSVSKAQFRTMAAVAHNPKFAKKVGISQKVGKEFHKADKKSDYEDLPARADEGFDDVVKGVKRYVKGKPSKSERETHHANKTIGAAQAFHQTSDPTEKDYIKQQMFKNANRYYKVKNLPKEVEEEKQRLDPKCWTGYKKQGTKMKGGVRVNNCVKVDEAEFTEDKLAQDLYKDLQIFKKGADKDIGSKAKDKEIGQKPKDKDIIAKEAANAAQQAAIAIAMKKKGQKPQNENAEYDDEAGSTESNLLTTARAVKGLLDTIGDRDNLPEWVQEKIAKAEGMLVASWDYLQSQKEQGVDPQVDEDWQKTNRKDKTDGMSPKAVKAYRRENPGSKLQTAVTKKPSELKAGSKDAKRRKSFCARMSGNPGPMKDEKGRPTPKAKALKRWNC